MDLKGSPRRQSDSHTLGANGLNGGSDSLDEEARPVLERACSVCVCTLVRVRLKELVRDCGLSAESVLGRR